MGWGRTFIADYLKAGKNELGMGKFLGAVEVLMALVIICIMLVFKLVGL